MKLADTYRIKFWGGQPDLILTMEKSKVGKVDSVSKIVPIAIHTVNEIAGREQVTEGSIQSIEVLAPFGCVIVERSDV